MKHIEKGPMTLPDFFQVEDPLFALEQIFVMAVTFAAIFPRMPLDEPWSIGGDLSKPFRRLLLGIFFLHWGRNTMIGLLGHSVPKPVYISLDALETVLLTCLCLLMPYLLRIWLSQRINIGGRPGEIFTNWVKAVAALSCLGAFLRITVDRKYWVLTKIADTLSFIPVTQTLALYASVTHSASRYRGRGAVLSQIALVVEYFALAAHTADGLSKILGLLEFVTRYQLNSSTSPTMVTVYAATRFATYLRVFCHSILLNSLDEAYSIGSAAASYQPANQDASDDKESASSRRRGPLVETISDEEEALVVL